MQKWIFSLPLPSPPTPPLLSFIMQTFSKNQTLKEKEGVGARDVGNPEKKEGECALIGCHLVYYVVSASAFWVRHIMQSGTASFMYPMTV